MKIRLTLVGSFEIKVYTRAHTHTRLYTYMHTHAPVYTLPHTGTHIHARTHTDTPVHTNTRTHQCAHTPLHAYMPTLDVVHFLGMAAALEVRYLPILPRGRLTSLHIPAPRHVHGGAACLPGGLLVYAKGLD